MTAKTASGTPTPAQQSDPGWRGLGWYILGLIVIGGAVGFFAGMSESPVVAAVLPLLFGLIGGSSGLFLATQDLSAPQARWRMNMLGICLCAFGLACLVASVYGIAVRSNTAISDFLPKLRAADNRNLKPNDDTDLSLRLALLDAKLARLGVEEGSRRQMVERARSERFGVMDDKSAEDLRLLQQRAAALLENIQFLVKTTEERKELKLPENLEYEEHPVVFQLVADLEDVVWRVPQWTQRDPDGRMRVVPRAAIAALAGGLADTVADFSGQKKERKSQLSVVGWLKRYDVESKVKLPLLSDYEFQVYQLKASFSAGDWIKDDETVADALDAFLSAKPPEEAGDGRHQRPRPSMKH